jgi:hypothetical protein
VITRTSHLFLSWATRIHRHTPSGPASWRSVLIPSPTEQAGLDLYSGGVRCESRQANTISIRSRQLPSKSYPVTLSSCHPTLHRPSTLRASLNNPRRKQILSPPVRRVLRSGFLPSGGHITHCMPSWHSLWLTHVSSIKLPTLWYLVWSTNYEALIIYISPTFSPLYLSIYPSIHLWLYSPLLGLARFFSFLIPYTVDRTPWMGDQLVARPLPKHRTAKTQNKRKQISMPWVGFEPTIPVF